MEICIFLNVLNLGMLVRYCKVFMCFVFDISKLYSLVGSAKMFGPNIIYVICFPMNQITSSCIKHNHFKCKSRTLTQLSKEAGVVLLPEKINTLISHLHWTTMFEISGVPFSCFLFIYYN